MDIGSLQPSSSTTSPVAGSNPFLSASQSGKSSTPAKAPVSAPASSAESMHVDMRSTQVTLSSNSNLQFAVPSNLVSSTPLYTAGMAKQLQSLQTQYANNLLGPATLGSGSGMDITKGETALGTFAEQELATQIGSDALANATVTFDNFSAQSSDTTSQSQTQTQIHTTQNQSSGSGTSTSQADLSQSTTVVSETSAVKMAGSGHITLANGQTIAFNAELDVSAAVTESDTTTDLAVSSASQSAASPGDTSAAAANPAPVGADTATNSSVSVPAASDSISTGQSLSALLKSLSPPPAPVVAPDPAADPAGAHTKKSHKQDDWNTMLSQYSNLMDIINSVTKAVDALKQSQVAGASPDAANQPVQTGNGTANSLIQNAAPA